jgi:general secretion pathway protein E
MTAGIGGRATTAHTTPSGIVGLWQPSPEGCEACSHTGFRGSVALTEVLPVAGSGLQTALLSPLQPRAIEQTVLKNKGAFIPMRLDGLVKALRGQTTINEVLRVGVPLI